VLGQLLYPGVCNEDGVSVGVVFWELEPLVVGVLNNLREVVALEGPENAEKEWPLRQPALHVLFGWEVLRDLWVRKGIVIEVLDRDLGIERDFEMDNLVSSKGPLLIFEDVLQVAQGRPMNGREEDADYGRKLESVS